MATPKTPDDVVVTTCSDPDHHHNEEYPIPAGGCPDPRQDGDTEPGDDRPKVISMARLNCQIPAPLEELLRRECSDRMIGVGLLVSRALEKFLDELPPAL